MMMKTIEILLNIASYGVLAMIGITIFRMAMKVYSNVRR